MKVILLEDVKAQGKQHDIVDVNPGYARNFLMKNKLAVPATQENLLRVKGIKRNIEKENEIILKQAQDLKVKLEKRVYKTTLKTGGKEKIFGSITVNDIIKLLEESGYQLKKTNIQMKNSIKTLGENKVKVKLHNEVTATIIIDVSGDKE